MVPWHGRGPFLARAARPARPARAAAAVAPCLSSRWLPTVHHPPSTHHGPPAEVLCPLDPLDPLRGIPVAANAHSSMPATPTTTSDKAPPVTGLLVTVLGR